MEKNSEFDTQDPDNNASEANAEVAERAQTWGGHF